MLFQAFTAASFSFGGLLPSVSSLAGKKACSTEFKCGDWLGQSKTFHFLPWWTPLLFWHYVLGHYLAAWWRISQSVWLHLSVNCQTKYFCRLELILLLPSCVTSLMKIKEPVPEEAMKKAQAITLPPLCFRWACMFGIMSRSFFLPTLAFPSLWSIKSVHKTLSQNFWGSSPILLANEWFASSGVASVLLFMKSSANSRLWYLHSCPLEVVADVTNSCFRVFLYSCHNVSVVNCWCFPWSTHSRCVT